MSLYCFPLINSEICQLTNRYKYQLVGKSYDKDVKHKRNNALCETKIKDAVSISIAPEAESLIINEKVASKEHETKTLRKYLTCRVSYEP